jgi:ferredoxin--NADP+ reductase
MSTTESSKPLRVAIIGGGPAAFFTALELLKPGRAVRVDLFERLSEPFGLVRYGVAPDHPHTRKVGKLLANAARDSRFRYFGGVDIGRDVTVPELRRWYDVLIAATGAEIDRRLDIPGEHLFNCIPSLAFAGWVNGHPEHAAAPDLSHETAVIVGNGNVALDVARLLAKPMTELEASDIAESAQAAIATSGIRTIVIAGRRGPVQASFGDEELAELGRIANCSIEVDPRDLDLNTASGEELLAPEADRQRLNVDTFRAFEGRPRDTSQKRIVFKFNRKPVAILGSDRVTGIQFEETELVGPAGGQQARSTGRTERIACGLVVKSIGHAGQPIRDLPFDTSRGVIPTRNHRVLVDDQPLPGVYAAGWLKRGAKGLIGHNRRDAMETVKAILEDQPNLPPCAEPDDDAVVGALLGRGIKIRPFPAPNNQ